MGAKESKPGFETVLADQFVKAGQDVALECDALTEKVTATWQKNGHELERQKSKHEVKCEGRTFTLIIRNAEQTDEGKYSITIRNKNTQQSNSCSAMLLVELRPWRIVHWKQDPMISELKNFQINKEDVRELRFLLHGPVGAGKSSIINTIKSIFDGHQHINCLVASDLSGTSFTQKYQKFTVENGPFAFYDVMGLEEGQSEGVRTDDIINALKGHLPDDYTFQINYSLTDDSKKFNISPTLNDKIHCLVSVVAADKITLMDYKVIEKMKKIRMEASKLGMPQVLFMTRVDTLCVMTKKDLTMVYKSKKIKEKMQECSNRLGVPMNCIFPVKNYHEATKSNEELNCLMLEAFSQIVHAADDYVKMLSNQ